MDVCKGTLEGREVRVAAGRAASALYSKGNHGTPLRGGGLALTLAEAAYLVEAGRLEVAGEEGPLTLAELLARGAHADPRFELRHLVYRDFRERGYVIREELAPSGMDFSVRPRGAGAKAPSKEWVLAVSESSSFEADAVCSFAERAASLDKRAVVAVVDEDGDITHYAFEPGLKAPGAPGKRPAARAEGVLSDAQVLVAGDDAVRLAATGEMFGRALHRLLRLSLMESAYLAQEGRLRVFSSAARREELTAEDLIARGTKRQRDFALRLAAYRALRHQGLWPKTGFKYGAHFRVYDREGGSPHARYLVHAVPGDFTSPWPELARGVRLAHGVKKRLVLALVRSPGAVRFLGVSWTRP